MAEILARLKQRKLVQWAIAYVAFAFALIQVLDVVASRFGWPVQLERSIILALAVGFVVALVTAWYHGEKGRQRVSGAELLLIALVLAVGGGLLWRVARVANPTGDRSVAAAQAVSIRAQSIAVLPFENLSGDPSEKYFSDGITEEILNALAQIPDLKVAARTSAFQFNSKGEDLRKVGETLGVANVLEGSVQRSGDGVRINVRLVNTRSGYQVWSEKYDRKLTNIFAIEDDISNAIAGKLRVQLTGGAGQALVAHKTIDSRAHDFYLRGLTLFAARGSRVHDAVVNFERAVAIDPQYAEAWGMLAEAAAQLPFYEPDTHENVLPRAQYAAQRALALDPNVASAYVALGVVRSLRWQWPEADGNFRRALSLAPNDAEAMNQRAQFLFTVGELGPALSEIDRAEKLDPLSAVIGVMRGAILTALHRFDEAQAQLETTLELHPDSV